MIQNPNQDAGTLKTMIDLAPSCPEASRVLGFPPGLKSKSKCKHCMVSLVIFCSSASSIKGFGSMASTYSTGFPNKAKAILIKSQKTRGEMVMTLTRQWYNQQQEFCYNLKSMVTLLTTCSKEARVYGFPSVSLGDMAQGARLDAPSFISPTKEFFKETQQMVLPSPSGPSAFY